MAGTKLILPPEEQRTKEWEQSFIDHYWLGLGDTTQIKTTNPFSLRTQDDIENPHVFILKLMSNPDNFGFTVKHLFGKRLAPFQLAIQRELWKRPFPMLLASRGGSKSFSLALYAMLRALFNQGSRIVVVGAAFRQAKVVFDYCQDLWDNAPVLQDLVGLDKKNGPRRDVDRCSLRMGDSIIVALPLGNGEKIRGQRANIILSDEFASIPVDIFETVVRGFAAVSSSPVEKLRGEARRAAIKALGKWTEAHTELYEGKLASNQTVVSGTAYYAFNHFYEYWKRYKAIVESKGDPRKLEQIFNGAVPEKFNWKDYSIIRIPVQMLPPGFMDEKQIAQAKATVHTGIYMMEYGCVFATDSNGFYRRSLIEKCVVGKPGNPIEHPSCGTINFHAVLKGDPREQYVIAVDPASEHDNLAIVVLEVHSDHRRIVHCWTTNRKRFKAIAKAGLTQIDDYYRYAARKIRELMKVFPTLRLAIDSQGGGVAIMEALQDASCLEPGERKLLPTIDPLKEKETDAMVGDHIIEVISFASSEWVSYANHGMRKDFETRELLFPAFDPAAIALAIDEDKATGRIKVDIEGNVERLYDTLEDCTLSIEELKDELASIVHTQTGVSLRDRWDTPETKEAGGKKGRLRKDRYSALLMANAVARQLARAPVEPTYKPMGGFARGIVDSWAGKAPQGQMYIGPSWWTENVRGTYGAAVTRGGDAF